MSLIGRVRAAVRAKHEPPWDDLFLTRTKAVVEAEQVKLRRKRLRNRVAPRTPESES